MSCPNPVSLNACLMERQGSLPEILADIVFPCGFNSWNTKTALIFLAIYVVQQRGILTHTYHWEEIKTATTETAGGREAVHASHCADLGDSFYVNWGFDWIASLLRSRWHMALVKCQFVLRSPVAFAAHILPCFCTKIGEHGHASALEIDPPSCLILPYIAGARWVGGWGTGGACLLAEPWVQLYQVARQLWITELTAVGSPLLGSAVIGTDLWGVECLHDLNPGQSGWRGCVL